MNLKINWDPKIESNLLEHESRSKSITTFWNKNHPEHLYTRILYIEGHFGKELFSEIGHNIHHANQ